jgi:hypothetical protein
MGAFITPKNKKMENQKMEIKMNDGLRYAVVERNEGIIFQNNYRHSGRITFSYFLKDYKDETNIYQDAIAKFTVKPKKQTV